MDASLAAARIPITATGRLFAGHSSLDLALKLHGHTVRLELRDRGVAPEGSPWHAEMGLCEWDRLDLGCAIELALDIDVPSDVRDRLYEAAEVWLVRHPAGVVWLVVGS